jgi:hypothetical protein
MGASAEYASLPFTDAIAFFRDKLSIPTSHWNDLWQDQHARAFTVAGATREGLLADIRQAVDKAISSGTTLEEFRKDFSSICDRAGWSPKGGEAWRARVIYETNLSTAYAAGHYKEMTDPDVVDERPYFRYVRSSSEHPRLAHLAWVGITLPWNDPFWSKHYPPNDWGCKCGVVSCSAKDIDRLKAEGVEIKTEAPAESTYEWTDKRTGEVHDVPKGIGPGWAYNPGKAAWGEQQSAEAWEAWQVSGEQTWERLTDGMAGGDWESAGRPHEIPVDTPMAKFGPTASSEAEVVAQLKELLGGEQEVFSFAPSAASPGLSYDLVVNAEVLGSHIDLARASYLPFLRETVEDPFEVWMNFERNRLTGQVRLSTRFIKRMDLRGKEGMLLVAQASKGCLEAWTAIPVSASSYLQKQRTGRLLWGR